MATTILNHHMSNLGISDTIESTDTSYTSYTSDSTYINECIPEQISDNSTNISTNTSNTTSNHTSNHTLNTTSPSHMFCTHCNKVGHQAKSCQVSVNSYGVICFYKKPTMVRENVININNDLFNKKTKKNENTTAQMVKSPNKSPTNTQITNRDTSNYSNHSTRGGRHQSRGGKYGTIWNRNMANISKIKILKRHETLTHTLKNMLGVVGGNQDDDIEKFHEELDGVIDVEEIIDMDGDLSIDGNTLNNDIIQNNQPPKMKEIIIDKVLLVQRRNTIGFIEFIRGKYEVANPDYIIKLFNMMTFDEKRIMREYDSFDMIRTLIGLKREFNYRGEYDIAKAKFNQLKQDPKGDQVNALLDRSYTKWTSPEWGIPKGRRSNKEFDIECAIREFVEETGVKYKNINVYRNIKPLEEVYRGINGVLYKHIYYFAEIKNTPEAIENITQIEKGGHLNSEIGNIKLFSLTESHKLIRPYYVSKLNVIKKSFQIVGAINCFFE